MNRTVFFSGQLALVSFLGIIPIASATPTPDPLTGVYYEFESSTATWDGARVNAASRVHGGKPGQLVSITSERENLIVEFLGGIGEKHIGLTDSTGISTLDGFNYATLGTMEGGNTSGSPLPAAGMTPVLGERGYGFRWLTSEPYIYQKWNSGEPNNGSNAEDGVRTGSSGTWIDVSIGSTVGESDSLRGYVVEYDTSLVQEKFSILERHPTSSFNSASVNSLAQAKTLLSLPPTHADVEADFSAQAYVVSFHDPELGGGLPDYVRSPYLSDVVGTNDEDFAFRATARVSIPTAGQWTFAVMAGDAFELSIGGNVFTGNGTMANGPARLTRTGQGTLTPAAGGSGDTFYFPSAGEYGLELISFESDFAAFVQLFAAPGDQATFDANLFDLVGDELNGGLMLVPGLPGDYNNNGVVDAADYPLWRKNLGSGISLANDDTPGVGQDDYTRWRTYFGQTACSGSAVNVPAVVPEPVTAILFVLGAAIGWCKTLSTPLRRPQTLHATG